MMVEISVPNQEVLGRDVQDRELRHQTR
jgi:hypothetical protein